MPPVAVAACLLGCAAKPRPTAAPSGDAGAVAKPGETHRLAVKLRGAGSVTGRVVSSPRGLDCEIVTNGGGSNEKPCEATLPAGPVTLQFTPTGAAAIAEFSFPGGPPDLCASTGGNTCALLLDRDRYVEVFPISVPPPQPRTEAPAAPEQDLGAPFQIVFQIHSGGADAKGVFSAKLRVKTTDGQTFDYKTPVSHPDCYLLANDSAPSASVVDGDKAQLFCSGGGQIDRATVSRKSDTLVEVSVFQEAFSGPDTLPAKPINAQTFSIRVPKGAQLRTTFGASCTSSVDCAKGEMCAGEAGCDKTWTCQPSRPCTKDLQPYCGCDGKTFESSGSCPAKKYWKKGGC
jgi:hypothetical protein